MTRRQCHGGAAIADLCSWSDCDEPGFSEARRRLLETAESTVCSSVGTQALQGIALDRSWLSTRNACRSCFHFSTKVMNLLGSRSRKKDRRLTLSTSLPVAPDLNWRCYQANRSTNISQAKCGYKASPSSRWPSVVYPAVLRVRRAERRTDIRGLSQSLKPGWSDPFSQKPQS